MGVRVSLVRNLTVCERFVVAMATPTAPEASDSYRDNVSLGGWVDYENSACFSPSFRSSLCTVSQ